MKKIINKTVCYFLGCKYPIEWRKERLVNDEIVEIGVAAPYQPCFRCGQLADPLVTDFEKINSEIKNDYFLFNIENKIETILKEIDYIRMGKCIECDERGMIDDLEIKGASSSCKCGYNIRLTRSLLLKRKE